MSFPEARLDVDGLSCIRDDRSLFSDLSFHLEQGGLLRIEGPNGSGKTSLLRLLCGLRPADSGEIRWNGKLTEKAADHYLPSMLYLGHLAHINGQLTPLENMRYLCQLRNIELSESSSLAYLKEVGLRGFEDIPARQLSAGQKRRVLLAFLLSANAQLWILDEPLTALDKDVCSWFEGKMLEHCAEGGMIIFTTHHGMTLDDSLQNITLGNANV